MRPIFGLFRSDTGRDGDRDSHPEILGAMAAGLKDSGYGNTWLHPPTWPLASGQVVLPGVESLKQRCGDLSIIGDTRIDGREDLIEALGDRELSESATDLQLILAAYRKWGEECPEHLIGDYAFAIADNERGSLFCARDHAGARPLFYCAVPAGLAFASDPSALLAITGLDTSLDDSFVLTTLSARQFFSFDRTFHRSIRKLPPGHSLTWEIGSRPAVQRYWQPGASHPIRLPSPGDYAARLRELMELAVADRLRDSRRLGVHISGGLDSTTIAGIAVPRVRARGGPDPIGFSWHRNDPDASPDSEPALSAAVAGKLGIPLEAHLPDRAGTAELLRRDWTRNPDPGNLINEAPIQRAAAAHGIDVILSGWGGDQAASYEGRGYRQGLLAKGRFVALWHDFGNVPPLAKVRGIARMTKSLAAQSIRGSDRRQWNFATSDLKRRADLLPLPIVRKTSARRTMIDLLEKGSITARLETWAASGAKLGIEYRYPLLDRRILDFCYAIPTGMFVHGGVSRWLMREAARDLLPDVVKRHATKKEPVRVESAAIALEGAFTDLREMVRARCGKFERAGYVDIDRLCSWLDKPRDDYKGQAPARIALQFLDFEDAALPDDIASIGPDLSQGIPPETKEARATLAGL